MGEARRAVWVVRAEGVWARIGGSEGSECENAKGGGGLGTHWRPLNNIDCLKIRKGVVGGSEGENGKGIEWAQCGRSAEGGGGGIGGRGEGGAGYALEAS